MKKNDKERLFEVTARLDKTFKPINEMDVSNENNNWFEQELGYLKNNETFNRVELRDILETIYKNVDISGQNRIMNILELFGMDEDFR